MTFRLAIILSISLLCSINREHCKFWVSVLANKIANYAQEYMLYQLPQESLSLPLSLPPSQLFVEQ